MEMWKSMDFHSLNRRSWLLGPGMWPCFLGPGSRKVFFFSMFFDQAERQWCKCHSCKVVEDRAGQICTWRIGWWVPCGWIHSIHYLRTYQVVPQIWNNWLVNLEESWSVKMNGSNTRFLLGFSLFSGAIMLVSRTYNLQAISQLHCSLWRGNETVLSQVFDFPQLWLCCKSCQAICRRRWGLGLPS